ncbi:hypothetical protein BAE44_0005505 [Dichanthelium oligosanthes]|uniref:Mitochondrial inner membrane protease subunit 2 n=1 Tax=Dichanthelium oligosanthes TaxID=888268 RepID=A0A1E5W811_9POAL|nr:hypothetical protein BAE44_0005505 [Dichanthelium oligosanthes]
MSSNSASGAFGTGPASGYCSTFILAIYFCVMIANKGDALTNTSSHMAMWFCSSKDGGNSAKRLMLLTCSMSRESSLIVPCVVCGCPSNHKELFVKRLIALPGEWIQLPRSPKVTKISEGHCWVEGDNAARSWDSGAFGPVSCFFCNPTSAPLSGLIMYKLIPLGLVEGRVTHIIWPPSKIGQVERKMSEWRISPV